MHDVTDLREMLADEIVERRESGHLVAQPDPRVLLAADDDELRAAIMAVEASALSPSWPYEEPDGLAAISAARAATPRVVARALGDGALLDRLHGAWLGRCAGCALGKPVENWPRAELRRYLQSLDAYPLTDYVPADGPAPPGFPALDESWPVSVRGAIRGMPRDDDLDYTILGLHILETYGSQFSAADVAREWLRRFPFLAVHTAERAAYRNLVLGLTPPATATHLNPYREWIGALIRVDAYAYAAAGDPERAATLAFQDASLSHTANGVYGAMWAAALIAASFAERTMTAALDTALGVVPPRSRLAEALRGVAALRARGSSWESARDALEERHGALSPVHAINNATVVAAALLWGEGDFTSTIGLAVQGGWDTDCNGATAGSAFGAMHGAEALPSHWTTPLEDRIASALLGSDGVRISDLATRSFAVAKAIRLGELSRPRTRGRQAV
ncbi:MAG TPA: ADP-ribosylglycohydrolase family protein [Solirubrobacteraceae bacterium]|nr:ADP-ribosylglycohydrolase family protein [Solirubrobacteraceae bacterium]